jgi:hypothetical protein
MFYNARQNKGNGVTAVSPTQQDCTRQKETNFKRVHQ